MSHYNNRYRVIISEDLPSDSACVYVRRYESSGSGSREAFNLTKTGEFERASGGAYVEPFLRIPAAHLPGLLEALTEEMIRHGKMLPSGKEIERLEAHLEDLRELCMTLTRALAKPPLVVKGDAAEGFL